MIYLLDTNSISRIMREDTEIARWLQSVRDDDHIVTCTIVRGEVMFGIKRITQGRRRDELQTKALKLFTALPCEAVPSDAADHYADLKLNRSDHWSNAGEPRCRLQPD